MKKILSVLCSIFIVLLFTGCQAKDPTISLKQDVTFELKDVMTITNDESNSIYYYYMATITNDSKDTYSTNDVVYSITDDGKEHLNPIDQHESMPITTVLPEQTAYVYGYIGFPNNNQNDMGFYFKDSGEFLSFNNVNVRKATNQDIKESEDLKFTMYEDNALKIEINAEDVKAQFENGKTTLSDLKITYTNKTEQQIVVPYLVPKADLNGILLTNYTDKGDFSSMNEEQIKKIDFTTNGLAPKTDPIEGKAFGYMVEYLDPEQSIECNVGFTFENAVINYQSKNKDCFDIHLVSSAFGITHDMTVSY